MHFISGIDYEDKPPAYETIVEIDRCPEYEEVILQIKNLPETEVQMKNSRADNRD